ncbi:PBSX family phage terminase large subunit [Allopusillimonas ginsengisoli]|uniref:PBSX family phage terminase large subunit n=1 Tax=Allopusillimonas ginsengisoli TaxID=453575 RepID=UPI00101EBC57|nr:PBSX family phage terminase large subunit [Allopusillimonas ginsengisoli]TEA78649.1 PBSX family phage terminase large subunit [Allopusillimonas ginsengisoli]
MTIKFPKKLRFLFQPYRYKVAHGGRGSAKSWSFARALLLQGTTKTVRVLCAREVQLSIKQSVHKLLKDQIELLGLTSFYEVLETEIRGINGTEFSFAGLSKQTVDSIKSFEGVDIVWVEEGQSVSKKSWDVLIPTIRKAGSEIWISLNPELETDETYQRFIANPPPNSCVVQVNYHDNPWFSEELEAERIHCQLTAPKDYDNIWLGKCKPAVSGAIYYDEVAAAEEGQRITNVPYDPMLKVHVVFDLGWNDAMAISLIQKGPADIRVIEYIEDSHKTLDHYSALLKGKSLNWGDLYLPHDGRNKDFKTGKSAEEIMTALGWSVKITPNMSIEAGIRLTRMTFPRMYFDKAKTERLIQCAKRYRRSINQQTNEPGAPMHDEWSHGADNLRYVAVNAESMTNETWGGEIHYPSLGKF